MAARVHVDPAAHGARDSDEPLDPGKPPVLDEHIGAEPEDDPGQPAVLRELQGAYHVLAIRGHREVARRSADPPGAIARERLVLEQLAAEFDFGRRRWSRRRFGLGFFDRLCYALAAATCPPVADFTPFALSCHSCKLLTLPMRLRSAMIASHAALAADMVVVYGTRCTSAARRMA